MAKTRVFISFDYDHDLDLKTLLVVSGQPRELQNRTDPDQAKV